MNSNTTTQPNEPQKIKLPVFSPSQISTYRLCARKWAWKSLHHVPEPQSKGAKLGDAVHKILERYLLTGTIDTEGGDPSLFFPAMRAAQALIPLLPSPGTVEVEKRLDWTSPAGVTYTGRVDWIDLRSGIVGDHKTTSDVKWIKSVEELSRDLQPIIYGKITGLRNFQWNYVTTKGATRVERREFSLDDRTVTEHFASAEADALEMLAIHADGMGAMDIAPSPEACGAFGGCAYIDRCTDIGSIGFFQDKEYDMTFQFDPKTMSVDDLFSPAAPATPPVADTPGNPPVDAHFEGLNPPENSPNTTFSESVATFEREMRETITDPSTLASTPMPKGEAPAKRGPGRPRKVPVASPAETTTATVLKEPNATSVPDDRQAPPAPAGRVVYVDCVRILQGASVNPADFMLAVNSRIATEEGAPHPSLVEFGKGVAMVSKHAAILAKDFPSPAFIDSRSYGASEAVAVLLASGWQVVRPLGR